MNSIMNEIILETQRLILRKINPQDIDSLMEILGDVEVMRFSIHGPDSREDVFKFIEGTLKRYDRDGTAQWAVIHKETNEFIGECGISVQQIDNQKEYEIGYRFKKSFWGKGYGSEAAIGCRIFGFEEMKLNRLISIIEKENRASIAVAKKLGMSLEKESIFYNIPVEIYAVSKDSL